jgi:hypothetical protein
MFLDYNKLIVVFVTVFTVWMYLQFHRPIDTSTLVFGPLVKYAKVKDNRIVAFPHIKRDYTIQLHTLTEQEVFDELSIAVKQVYANHSLDETYDEMNRQSLRKLKSMIDIKHFTSEGVLACASIIYCIDTYYVIEDRVPKGFIEICMSSALNRAYIDKDSW